jgi:hypothetical protein
LMVLFTPVDDLNRRAYRRSDSPGHRARPGDDAGAQTGLACVMADDGHGRWWREAKQVPLYAFPGNAARALGKNSFATPAWRSAAPTGPSSFSDIQPPAVRRPLPGPSSARGATTGLPAEETSRVLDRYGIDVVAVSARCRRTQTRPTPRP